MPDRPLSVRGPGRPITDVVSWFEAAPPKQGARHWKPGRSALELANAWCRTRTPSMPAELVDVLASDRATRGFDPFIVLPEHITPLDGFRGEARNHDLVAIGMVGSTRTLLAVEAKAGELFGDKTAGEQWAAGRAKKGSNIPARIAHLVTALTGEDVDPAANSLRSPLKARGYQLLTASVGTVIEAERQGCKRAVLVVHEFDYAGASPATRKKAALAHADLEAFVATLSGAKRATFAPGTVVGPFPMHATPFVSGKVPLHIAVCRTEVAV